MAESIQYISVTRIFNKLSRDLRGTELNESDVIEWIGEALDFLRVSGTQEESIAFITVKDHMADVPIGLQTVLQIARNNNYSSDECLTTADIADTIEDTVNNPVFLDCQGKPIVDYDVAYYRPFFDLQWEYDPWSRSNLYATQYTPVRLANHTLFGSIVCKEKGFDNLYTSKSDEYNIVGTDEKKFRFSFREGSIAVSYLKTATDEEGYPLIPDQVSYITAITYFVKWKLAEWYAWNSRDGSVGNRDYNEKRWLKYVRQAKNWTKMPKGIDQYQNLLEESHYLIPRLKKYYGFFGNLGRSEDRVFNDPDYRKKFESYDNL
tara:strand:- start:6011 stop:6970 length:960 start_codon:yes stop_codon:yes gene_type:complete